MKQRGRFFGAALAGMLGGVACGGDSTGPGASAASVTGVAGDNQTAPTGATLTFPLSFIALSASGQPVPGVHVTWSSSPSGAASFHPSDSTTDANGSTSTTVTTTAYVGNITMSAKVTGVADVVYHATVVNPCTYLVPVAVGETVNGSLASTDCQGNAWYYDFYTVTLTGQQNIRIDMHADTNDTFLVLWSGVSPFPFIAFNDDSILTRAGARNSQLDIILPAGDYIVGATSFSPFDKFPYSLGPKFRPTSMSGCREVWVVSGVAVSDDISAQDCTDSAATPHHYDVARIFVPAGSVLSVAERSTTINPSLALYKMTDTLGADTTYVREFVASNDDSSATTQNAFLGFTVDTSNYYDVVISTSAGGETGAYTFSVNVTAALTARYPLAPKRAREWWRAIPGEIMLQSPGLRSKKL